VEKNNGNADEILKQAEASKRATADNTCTKTYVSEHAFFAIMSKIVLVVLSFLLLVILQIYGNAYFPTLEIEIDKNKAALSCFMLVVFLVVYAFWSSIVKTTNRVYSSVDSTFLSPLRKWVLYWPTIHVPVCTLVSVYKNAPEGEFFTMIRIIAPKYCRDILLLIFLFAFAAYWGYDYYKTKRKTAKVRKGSTDTGVSKWISGIAVGSVAVMFVFMMYMSKNATDLMSNEHNVEISKLKAANLTKSTGGKWMKKAQDLPEKFLVPAPPRPRNEDQSDQRTTVHVWCKGCFKIPNWACFHRTITTGKAKNANGTCPAPEANPNTEVDNDKVKEAKRKLEECAYIATWRGVDPATRCKLTCSLKNGTEFKGKGFSYQVDVLTSNSLHENNDVIATLTEPYTTAEKKLAEKMFRAYAFVTSDTCLWWVMLGGLPILCLMVGEKTYFEHLQSTQHPIRDYILLHAASGMPGLLALLTACFAFAHGMYAYNAVVEYVSNKLPSMIPAVHNMDTLHLILLSAIVLMVVVWWKYVVSNKTRESTTKGDPAQPAALNGFYYFVVDGIVAPFVTAATPFFLIGGMLYFWVLPIFNEISFQRFKSALGFS